MLLLFYNPILFVLGNIKTFDNSISLLDPNATKRGAGSTQEVALKPLFVSIPGSQVFMLLYRPNLLWFRFIYIYDVA